MRQHLSRQLAHAAAEKFATAGDDTSYVHDYDLPRGIIQITAPSKACFAATERSPDCLAKTFERRMGDQPRSDRRARASSAVDAKQSPSRSTERPESVRDMTIMLQTMPRPVSVARDRASVKT